MLFRHNGCGVKTANCEPSGHLSCLLVRYEIYEIEVWFSCSLARTAQIYISARNHNLNSHFTANLTRSRPLFLCFSGEGKKGFRFCIFDCHKMTNRLISCRISYWVNGLIDVRMQCLPRWKLDSFGFVVTQARQTKVSSHTQWNSTLRLPTISDHFFKCLLVCFSFQRIHSILTIFRT